jgi:serine phosphatase RsbU (regulator of sigma subunit)
LLERSEFLETKIALEPGEGFLLYTDGLYGSGREEDPRLSSSRLGEMLQPIPASAQMMLNRVVDGVAMTNGDRPAPDDVAAVAVRRSN